MAVIGLKYPVVATYNVGSDGSVTYSNGTVMAKAIKADIKWNKADATLYADDDKAEELNNVIDGTISEEINELSYDVQALLFGHTKGSTTDETLTVKDSDNSAYVGHGFYGPIIRDNVIKYRAVWFPRCKFSEPDESLETKGEKPTIQSITVEGTISKDASDVLKEETIVATEAAAKTWLKGKASIS